MQHDKEQEMIGSVSQNENAPKITLSEFTDPEELMDKELDARVIGKQHGHPFNDSDGHHPLIRYVQPKNLNCQCERKRKSDHNVLCN